MDSYSLVNRRVLHSKQYKNGRSLTNPVNAACLVLLVSTWSIFFEIRFVIVSGFYLRDFFEGKIGLLTKLDCYKMLHRNFVVPLHISSINSCPYHIISFVKITPHPPLLSRQRLVYSILLVDYSRWRTFAEAPHFNFNLPKCHEWNNTNVLLINEAPNSISPTGEVSPSLAPFPLSYWWRALIISTLHQFSHCCFYLLKKLND